MRFRISKIKNSVRGGKNFKEIRNCAKTRLIEQVLCSCSGQSGKRFAPMIRACDPVGFSLATPLQVAAALAPILWWSDFHVG
jgi:hypothetical protein